MGEDFFVSLVSSPLWSGLSMIPSYDSDDQGATVEKHKLNYFVLEIKNIVNGAFVDINHLTPNCHFSGRTAPLTYRC
jgi:hypothetical protein